MEDGFGYLVVKEDGWNDWLAGEREEGGGFINRQGRRREGVDGRWEMVHIHWRDTIGRV